MNLYNVIKRFFDIFLSFFLLVLLMPLLFAVSIFIFLFTKDSIFFSQPRPGKNGKIFNLFKFRTMNNNKDLNGGLLPDHERVTTIGKFLRMTSIDELPQLWNVMLGDMSIIGPRPLLVEYLDLYSETEKKRHNVRPGITGWAQVNGRNLISWEEKFKLDLWYVENVNFFIDIKIIILTIAGVFFHKGINPSSGLSVEKFKGTK